MHIFCCLTVIRLWLKLPTGGHGHLICIGNLRGLFSLENAPEGCTETHKNYLFLYKQVSGRNGDHQWLRMTNAFILCDLVWKVQKSHAANREGSFNIEFVLLDQYRAYDNIVLPKLLNCVTIVFYRLDLYGNM